MHGFPKPSGVLFALLHHQELLNAIVSAEKLEVRLLKLFYADDVAFVVTYAMHFIGVSQV